VKLKCGDIMVFGEKKKLRDLKVLLLLLMIN